MAGNLWSPVTWGGALGAAGKAAAEKAAAERRKKEEEERRRKEEEARRKREEEARKKREEEERKRREEAERREREKKAAAVTAATQQATQGAAVAGGMGAAQTPPLPTVHKKSMGKPTKLSDSDLVSGQNSPQNDFYASAFPSLKKKAAAPVAQPEQDEWQKAWVEIFTKSPVMVIAEYAKKQGEKNKEERKKQESVPKQETKTEVYQTPGMTEAVTGYNQQTDAEVNAGYQKIVDTKHTINQAETAYDDKRHDPELAAMEAQELANRLSSATPEYLDTAEGKALLKQHDQAVARSQDMDGAQAAANAEKETAETNKEVLHEARTKVYDLKQQQNIVNTTAAAIEAQQTNQAVFAQTASSGAGNPVEQELQENTNRQYDNEKMKSVEQIDAEKDQIRQQLAANPQYIDTPEGKRMMTKIDELDAERKKVIQSASKWEIMPAEDQEILRWIYATKGEDAAREFYKARENIYLELDFHKAMERNLAAYQNEDPTVGQRISAGTNAVLASPGKVASYVGTVANAIENAFAGEENWKDVNMYSGAYDAAIYAQELKKYATKGLSDGEAFFANMAMSGGEMLLALPFNVFAPVIIGASEAGDSTLTALQNGATAEEAALRGTVSGVAATMLEKIPIDNLFSIKSIASSQGKRGIKETAQRLLKQGIIEGTEEIGEDVIDVIADISILKDKGEVARYLDAYIEENPNSTKAEQNAAMALYLANRFGQAGAGGFIMGEAFGGGAELAGRFSGSGAHEGSAGTYGKDAVEGMYRQTEYVPGDIKKSPIPAVNAPDGTSTYTSKTTEPELFDKTIASVGQGVNGNVNNRRSTPKLDALLGKGVVDEMTGRGSETTGGPVVKAAGEAQTPRLDALLGTDTMRDLKAGVDSVSADGMMETGTRGAGAALRASEGGNGYGQEAGYGRTEEAGYGSDGRSEGDIPVYGELVRGADAGAQEQNWLMDGATGENQAGRGGSGTERRTDQEILGEDRLQPFRNQGSDGGGEIRRSPVGGGVVPPKEGRTQKVRRSEYEAFRGGETQRRKVDNMQMLEITAQKLPGELKAIVEQNYGRGIETVLVMDDITFRMEANGKTAVGRARGFAENGRVYIKVNNTFTAEQINGHETFHVEAARYPEEVQVLQREIDIAIPKDVMRAIFDGYRHEYSDIYGADKITDLAQEEILADIAGGMNPLSSVPEVRAAIGRFYDTIYGKGAGEEFRSGIDQSRLSKQEAAGEPAVFSLDREADAAAEIMRQFDGEEGSGTQEGPSFEEMMEEAAQGEKKMSAAQEEAAASGIMEELTGGKEAFDSRNEDAIMMAQEIRKRIRSNEFPKVIRQGQQNKHIEGTHEYEQYVQQFKDKGEYGPSRLTITEDEAIQLIKQYAGKSEISIKKGKWCYCEVVLENDKIVGVVVNNRTGQEIPTTVFKMHYSKQGIHIVPDYPSKKGKK